MPPSAWRRIFLLGMLLWHRMLSTCRLVWRHTFFRCIKSLPCRTPAQLGNAVLAVECGCILVTRLAVVDGFGDALVIHEIGRLVAVLTVMSKLHVSPEMCAWHFPSP